MIERAIRLRAFARCALALTLLILASCGGSSASNPYAGGWTQFVLSGLHTASGRSL
jgi:hypothetical protein